MLKNYHKINENETVESFLKEVSDKKNSHYIILDNGDDYVDFRTIALKVRDPNEKLKSLKKSISKSKGRDFSEHLMHMIDSGERVIKAGDDYFDFISALEFILENYPESLDKSLENVDRKEIFALNETDKISNAKSLFLNKNVNLLPVIKDLEVVGEVRTFDFLASDLFSSRGHSNLDYYDANRAAPVLNLTVDNFMNVKPHTIDKSKSMKDAVEFMIKKSLPSVIVTEGSNLHSIVSYKDVFKLIKSISTKKKYKLEIIGNSSVYGDEAALIEQYAEKSMDKIAKLSDYDSMKISLKSHGNVEGTHQRKIEMNILISHGNKVLTVEKEISGGTSDEISNDKVKGKWNIPQMAQEALKAIEKKVIDEKSKNKR